MDEFAGCKTIRKLIFFRYNVNTKYNQIHLKIVQGKQLKCTEMRFVAFANISIAFGQIHILEYRFFFDMLFFRDATYQ